MSELVIVHSGDRYGLLAAALLRGKLGRGRAEMQRPETLLRFLRREAQRPSDCEVYVVGLTVRPRESERIAALLQKFAEAEAPVCWISHRPHPEEIVLAVKRFCRPESTIDPTRQESIGLVRERLDVNSPAGERFVWVGRKTSLAEEDEQLRPWLYALDRVESQSSRHPGYLQQLLVRLSDGFPDEMNSIDKLLYQERATAVRRSREQARGFITRELTAGAYRLALADVRGEVGADWALVADAIVGSEGEPLADILVLITDDGSVKLRSRSGLDLHEAMKLHASATEVTELPGVVPGDTPGLLMTRPGFAGFVPREIRAEVEQLIVTLLQRLSGAPTPATTGEEIAPAAPPAHQPPVKDTPALVVTASPTPSRPPAPGTDALAKELAAARHADCADELFLHELQATSEFAPLPADLVGSARLYRVQHAANGEPDGLALVIDDEAATPLGGGVLEEALQAAFETAIEQRLGHIYIKTPDGRYGAAEILTRETCSLVRPVSPQAAPVPWDGGHYSPLALREDWQNMREFADVVRLVRVDPAMEVLLDHSSLRVSYRGVRVLELRRRGRAILGPDREGIEYPVRRFRRLGTAELSQVARIKRAVDNALDARGARRARVPEIASKVFTDNRGDGGAHDLAERGYVMVARDVTFPEARHLRLHLLAVNRETNRLAALHVAVPGTMSFPRWPLRALRLAHWLEGPRLQTVAADAARVLAQKTRMELPGYEALAVDGSAPIETVLLVPRGERVASDEFEQRFSQMVDRLHPEGGLRVVALPDWTNNRTLLPSTAPAAAPARKAKSA